ncbi:MAG: hypothetical protein ACREHG_00425 [Candidatus Saccharimonadales bacterium]
MPPRTELKFTPANILDFAKKYSLYALDAAAGYVPTGQTQLSGKYSGFRHTVVGNTQNVAHIKVERETQAGRSRAADFIVKPSLTDLTGTPCYFLPWDSRGAAVEMTIPPFNIGDDATANPPIFFTAVLSGCSIVFKGSPAKPTIFHCGTAGGGEAGASTTGDSNKFFKNMLINIRNQGLGRSKKGIQTQVLSTDYMHTRSGGGVAPAHETAFQNKLQTHYDQQLFIENVNMWGTVFGFRTGTQWAFYLQENATICYRKVEDIMKHFIAKAATNKTQGAFDLTTLTPAALIGSNIPVIQRARPAIVKEVFPGTGHAVITSRWKTLKV